MSESILVTGATGFVGSGLCGRLKDLGYLVRGTTRTATRSWTTPCAELIELSDRSTDEMLRAGLRNVRYVVHLAARVHVMKDRSADPIGAFREVNTDWTERLARAAADEKVERFLYLSSIKVNGERTHRPFTETDPPRPQDPYGMSKWEAEQALHRVANDTGLGVTVLRSPLVYGPGVRGNFLELLHIVRRHIPLPLGAVRNKRSLLYRDNLIDALIRALRCPAAAGQTYLLSDGEDLSTPELVRRLGRRLRTRVWLWSCPPSALYWIGRLAGKACVIDRLVGSLQIDSSKIRRDLGWHPPFTVDQGLEKTVDWYESLTRKGIALC